MKISIFYTLVLLLIQVGLFSQEFEDYIFEDGSSIGVKVNSLNPDNGLRGNVYVGIFGPTGHIMFGGYNHYIPEKLYINGLVGYTGGILDATLILKSDTKEKILKQSVRAESTYNTLTKYVVKIPSEKRRSFGIHTGLEVLNSDLNEDFKKQALGIIGGISFLRARYANLEIRSDYEERQGSLVNRLNLDVIVYPIRNVGRELLPDETIDDELGLIGGRLYFDGRASLWSKRGRFTINYMLGVGFSPDPNVSSLFGGLGFGYGFY